MSARVELATPRLVSTGSSKLRPVTEVNCYPASGQASVSVAQVPSYVRCCRLLLITILRSSALLLSLTRLW